MREPATVVVTGPSFVKAPDVFNQHPSLRCVVSPPEEDRLAEIVEQSAARGAVVGTEAYVGPLYRALPSGGVIARFGVGHEGIDKALATRHGLFCTNTPGVLESSVAELTMGLVLAAARHLGPVSEAMRSGNWAPRVGCELRGKTLAVVGMGSIGSAVADVARLGFGMRIAPARSKSEFRSAVAEADFVSLHIPARADNGKFLDADRIAMIPARAWLINTARGTVVDEGALYRALSTGKIAGAALDVFEREPYTAGDVDFRRLPNVLLTPHIGSNTREANTRMAVRALDNILAGLKADVESMDLLNPEVADGRYPPDPVGPSPP